MNPTGASTPDGTPAIANSTPKRKKPNKPTYSKFWQQELPAWKPILTPSIVVALFGVVGMIFIILGLVCFFASENVVEIVDRYDTDCIPSQSRNDEVAFIQNSETNKVCTRTLTVPKYMKSPIYVYYQIENFYQNHRRYVRSRSDKQLRGETGDKAQTDCEPVSTTQHDSTILPCGLVAWSLFNDTYTFSTRSRRNIDVNKTDIAWRSDKEDKFGSDVYPKNFQMGDFIGGAQLNASIPLSHQEDLIVWMRTAALPTFRKIYGRIEMDVEADSSIEVIIQNNYNTYSFGGKKKLVLSTATWIGGKNDFLGLACLGVGSLCILLAMGFIALYIFKPRSIGDPSYLSWNRNPEGLIN